METAFLGDNKNMFKMVFTKALEEHNIPYPTVYSKDEILNNKELFSDTKFILATWGIPIFTEEEIREIFPSLKCVFYAAGSVQRFARTFYKCGVRVFSSWIANAISVAEFSASQIILAGKGFYALAPMVKNHQTPEAKKRFREFKGNYHSNIGIIGAGTIGKLVIQLLKPTSPYIYVYDPFLPDEKAKELGVTKTSLDFIFENCSVISNHLANVPETVGIINYSLLSKLQKNAAFVNTGRGAQVNEDDLIRILRERPDITALLDVTITEPPVENSPFYELDNCYLSPHIAGSSGNEFIRMAGFMLENRDAYLKNEPLNYEITLEMLEHMA